MTAPYQFMPALAADEQEQLRADIERYGVRVPVDVDEDGQILDGHHRAAIAADLGIDYPTRVLTGLSEQQKRAHVLSTNVHRRHLTQEQRRNLVADLLRADPAASNREHARQAGVDDKTVASVRTQLEESAEIPHFSERRDPRTGNLTQPAGRPTATPPEPEPAPEPPTGPTVDELAARAVQSYPELQYYVETGKPKLAIDTARALDGYDSAERVKRRETLHRAIAADRRDNGHPPPTPDFEAARDDIGRRARAGEVQNAAAVIARQLDTDPDCVIALVEDNPAHLVDLIIDPLFTAHDLLGVATKKLRRAHLKSVPR